MNDFLINELYSKNDTFMYISIIYFYMHIYMILIFIETCEVDPKIHGYNLLEPKLRQSIRSSIK